MKMMIAAKISYDESLARRKDPGQNNLVNTERDPEWLLAGRDLQVIAGLLPKIATPRQPLRNSRV